MVLRKRMEENARLGGAWDWPHTMKFGSWLVVAAGAFWLTERLFFA